MSGSAGQVPTSPSFTGYEVLSELGRGGMGVVYRVRDERRGEVVALKTLAHADAGALYRFKNEFRGFAALSHPNLVALYDLVSDGATWFFTMECVEGRPFLDHVRRDAPPGEVACDVERLCPALRQLAEGLAALHRAGKVHRDVKPSNVLVTAEGRVVLLDFGLGTDASNVSHDASRSQIVGTMDYMAPEQGFGRQVSPAADWYSVGVMLHEALTGSLPLGKRGVEALIERHHNDVPAPSTIVKGIPEDIDRLAADLLRRDPSGRPSDDAILTALSGSAAPAATAPVDPATVLVGRERHLEALEDAYAASRKGTVIVFLEGRSGMGKTALAKHFIDNHPEAVVLFGRCYERESVPFKALDAAIDSLSRCLGRLPETEVEALLPRDCSSLTQMFPVLRRVPAVEASAARGTMVPDPIESRRRATQGLREVLARVGDRKALLVFVDDLQWGDADSASLLADLLRPPEAPRLLFLGCHRSEDSNRSPFLDGLKPLLANGGVDSRRVSVEPLTRREAADLCLRVLGRTDPVARAAADRVAAEAEGSPLFAGELARTLTAEADARRAGDGPTFQSLVTDRLESLDARARAVLDTVAVAARPTSSSIVAAAAGERNVSQPVLAALVRIRLLRVVGTGEADALDVYHDRVREVVIRSMSEERAGSVHAALARALESAQSIDSEALARHWEGAGRADEAARHYVAAAAEASRTFAFEHAVSLYRHGLTLEAPTGERRAALLRALADALVSARRGSEAASTYIEAAAHAAPGDALELRRLAGEEYLRCGRLDEGTAILDDVLRRAGLKPPGGPRRALVRVVVLQAYLRLRGSSFRVRADARLSVEEQRRLRLCYAIGTTYSTANAVLGRLYLLRYARLARRAGDRHHIALALFCLAAHTAVAGIRHERKARELWERARSILDAGPPDEFGEAMAAWCRAGIRLGPGHSAEALALWSDTIRAFRAIRGGHTSWELSQAMFWRMRCLEAVGRIGELAQDVRAALQEAQDRMNLSLETDLRVRMLPICHLAEDSPGAALSAVDSGIARWSRRTLLLQHLYALVNRANSAMYRGDGESAYRTFDASWPSARRSLLMRVEMVRVYVHSHRGRCALAASGGVTGSSARGLLGVADQMASSLLKAPPSYARSWGHLLRAGIDATEGRRAEARSHLLEAEGEFASAGMALYLAVARRQRGLIEGGEAGRSLVAEAEAGIRELGVKNPARWSAMYAPGFDQPS